MTRSVSKPRFWHRVRFKLLLVSLTLLGIPWAGYRFIQETEQFLRDAQDQALQTTASSVANIMHGHGEVFHGVARPGSVVTFRNLYLHPMTKPPQIDGYRDEWIHVENNFSVLESVDETLEARIFLGQHERYLYLLLGVRDPQAEFAGDGDAVDLAFTDQDGMLQRYRIEPQAPGWVMARRQYPHDEPVDEAQERRSEDPAIRGEWQVAPDGYTLELRMPRELMQDRLSLRIYDGGSHQVLASGHLFPADSLGRLVQRSPRLDQVLSGLTPPATRIWVTDHQGLVLARSGQLDIDAPLSADQPSMPWFVQRLILAVLPGEADAIVELPDDQTHLFVAPVVDALSGRPGSLRRQPRPDSAVVISAAVPIRSSEGIKGAVLVEQTTNAILSIQNLALQRLFSVTLLFFAVTSLGLLAFASLLASRITRLRNRVESAVSPDGRIIGRLQEDDAKDEIGDLGRSFSNVLHRLHEYNHYLEAMASRLAHELRTPLAVVRSSLDNAEQAADSERDAYLRRARHGAERLEKILIHLREATGLEQSLRQAAPVEFDIADLLRRQTEGLQTLYPATKLKVSGVGREIRMVGLPDLICQALDKLLSNAIDFHRPGSDIEIACHLVEDEVQIAVNNEGPPLPPDADVFQSMFSGREGRQDEPHLGLGLYLVRLICEYHRGHAEAISRVTPDGVSVILHLPCAR